MKSVKVGLVGLGYWGPNILRNLQVIQGVEVTYCCDLKKELFDKVFVKGKTNFTTNFKDVIGDPNVNAVIIATPVSSHFSLARQALEKGKHVLVEKPFTQNLKQAEELVKIAKQKGLVLMVGHTFVYSEAVNKIKKIALANNFGNLNSYDSTRTNLGIIQKEINVIWDLATHDFSILNHICPEKPISLYAFGVSKLGKENEETAHIFLRYKNNFHAHIHVSWLSPVKIRTILIGGTKQFIKFNDIEPSEKITIYNKGVTLIKSKITPFNPIYRSGGASSPFIKQKESLLNEIEHFIESIKKNRTPITSGEEAIKVIKLLEATDKSLKTKKEVILDSY